MEPHAIGGQEYATKDRAMSGTPDVAPRAFARREAGRAVFSADFGLTSAQFLLSLLGTVVMRLKPTKKCT
jgi:hypothetical protein